MRRLSDLLFRSRNDQRSLLARFRHDERGVFLIIFAILGVVLIATSGAVVDFSHVQQTRTRAQTALDSAALALQATITNTGVTKETLTAQAQALLTERIADPSITAVVDAATPDLDAGKLTITGYVVVPTAFVRLVGIPTVRAAMLSEVTKQSSDIEVAVAADITYSMRGAKLTALKDAMKEMIKIIVKTEQRPTYSKMAIAPYSNGVNVGSYASIVRPITTGKTITSLTYSTGTTRSISGITQAEQGVITYSGTNTAFSNGDWVAISGVSGMTQINGKVGQVANHNPTNKTFNLSVNGTNLCTTAGRTGCGFDRRTSGGTITKCIRPNCREVVTTSSAHGHADNDYVYITGASGTSNLNNRAWQVDMLSATTYELLDSGPANGTSTAGRSDCTLYGCVYYRYANAETPSGMTVFKATECAVERVTDTDAFTDTPATTTPVGVQYATVNNADYPGTITLEACPTSEIMPLTDSRSDLEGRVNGFVAQGSTAGHIGLAWAWYMLSPTFIVDALDTAWPTKGKPAVYGKDNLVKAIVLMTDGEFNTMYHYGVPSLDADLANANTRSATAAPNGSSLAQAAALCAAIKALPHPPLLFTIGFQMTSGSAGDSMLRTCASDATMYKTASDAATLKRAFEDIARNLSELRVSR